MDTVLTDPSIQTKGDKIMILVRDEFQLKVGGADAFVQRFKDMSAAFNSQEVIKRARVLTDLSGRFDTVVLESEVESLDAYFAMMKAMFANREAGAPETDPDLYREGSRTFYTIEAWFEPGN